MVDQEYLQFNLETVDEGTPMTAHYGSVWAARLLGVAKQLTNPDIWDPSSQVELAVQYANELVTRLMIEADMSAQVMSKFPVVLEPMYMEKNLDIHLAVYAGNANTFYRPVPLTDANDIEDWWMVFWVFLTAGDYIFTFHSPVNNNMGKMSIYDWGELGISYDAEDRYAPAPDDTTTFERSATAPIAGEYRIQIRRRNKNPASSGGFLVLLAVDIRRD